MTLFAPSRIANPTGQAETDWFVTAGSVPGRDHQRRFKNNQDAVALSAPQWPIVAAVADGCSSGRYSEVGARLATTWLSARLPALWRAHARDELRLLRRAEEELLAYLRRVFGPLSSSNEGLTPAVSDFGLFTLLVAVVDRETSLVFGLGDGVFARPGRAIILESGPDNAPPYLGYRLVPRATVGGRAPHPLRILYRGSSQRLDGVLLATDGLSEVLDDGVADELLTDPRYLRNPLSVQRRLIVLSQNQRRLADDTSVALIRRRRAP